jgi:hypothetical protein
MFCGETSRWTSPTGCPDASLSSCAAWSPASESSRIRIRIGRGTPDADAEVGGWPESARATTRASVSPSMYSITR